MYQRNPASAVHGRIRAATEGAKAMRTRLNRDGRLHIPAQYLKQLGIGPGSEVELVWEGDGPRITTGELEIRRARALGKLFAPSDDSPHTLFGTEDRRGIRPYRP